MDVRGALLQRITSRMTRMRQAFDRFNDRAAERAMVSLTWNARDLAAHMAHWTNEGAEQIRALAAGGEKKDYDLDRINEAVYQKNRHMSFVMLLPQLREAEERFVSAVQAVRPDLLVGDTPVREWIDSAGIDHYDKHWPALEEAVDRLGE